jgi:hypothetical protein
MGRQDINLRAMENSRAAMRAAEDVLTAMQGGGKPLAPAGANVSITPLPTAAESPDMQWVQVNVEYSGRTAELSGVAPRSALSGTPNAPLALAGGGR